MLNNNENNINENLINSFYNEILSQIQTWIKHSGEFEKTSKSTQELIIKINRLLNENSDPHYTNLILLREELVKLSKTINGGYLTPWYISKKSPRGAIQSILKRFPVEKLLQYTVMAQHQALIKLESQNNNFYDMIGQIEYLKETMNHTVQENVYLKTRITSLEQVLQKTKEEWCAVNSENDDLKKTSKILYDKLEELEKKNKSLSEQLDIVNEENNQLLDQIKKSSEKKGLKNALFSKFMFNNSSFNIYKMKYEELKSKFEQLEFDFIQLKNDTVISQC